MFLSYKNVSNENDYVQELSAVITKDLRLDEVKPLNIVIELKNLYSKNYRGYCASLGYKYNDYRLVINNESSYTFIVNTIAHELRHIQQRVNDTHEARHPYTINSRDYTQEQLDKYLNQPSEIDAREYSKEFCARIARGEIG
jgi:hypothetical protein